MTQNTPGAPQRDPLLTAPQNTAQGPIYARDEKPQPPAAMAAGEVSVPAVAGPAAAGIPVTATAASFERAADADQTAGASAAAAPPLPPFAVLGCWLLGWLYWYRELAYSDLLDHVWLFGREIWLDGTAVLFTLLFCAGALALRRWYKARVPAAPSAGWEHLFWFGCALVISLARCFDRFYVVPAFTGLSLWYLFAVYGVLAATGQLTDGVTGAWCVPDMLRGVGRGFAGLAEWPAAVWRRLTTPRHDRGADKRGRLATALCVAAAVGLLALAAGWLGAADDGFARLLEMASLKNLWPDLGIWFWAALLALPTGAWFFGLAVGGRRALAVRPRPTAQARSAMAQRWQCLPARVAIGVLLAFCGLYVVFFAVQGQYLFGSLIGRLPQGFTVAGWARQGFFELCRVMGLNLALLGAVRLLATPPEMRGTLRIAAAVLLGQSLLLWLTAAAKLGLYIATFGFTPKRLLAAWALMVLCVAAVRSLMGLWRRCTVVRPTVLAGAAGLALLCLV